MKKRRLIISIILAVALLVSATVSAMGTITYETKTSVNSDGSYTFYVNAENEQGGENEYQWYECNASGGNANLIAGANGNVYQPPLSTETKYYYCKVSYQSEDGTDSVTTKVIKAPGHEEEKTDVEIMTFAIGDIDTPVAGEKPDTTAVVSGSAAAGCTVTSVTWEPRHSTFQENTSYTVTVTIKLAEGYTAGEGFKCTVNGQTAIATGAAGSDTVGCYYSFEPTEPIVSEGEEEDIAEKEESSTPLGIPGAIWAIVIILLLAAAIIIIVSLIKRNRGNKSGYSKDVEKAMREEAEQQEDIRQIKKIRAQDRQNLRRQAQEDLDSLNRGGKAYKEEDLYEEEKPIQKKATRMTISRDTLERKVTKDTLSLQKMAEDEEIKNKQDDELDNNISYFDDMPEDGKFDPTRFI